MFLDTYNWHEGKEPKYHLLVTPKFSCKINACVFVFKLSWNHKKTFFFKNCQRNIIAIYHALLLEFSDTNTQTQNIFDFI